MQTEWRGSRKDALIRAGARKQTQRKIDDKEGRRNDAHKRMRTWPHTVFSPIDTYIFYEHIHTERGEKERGEKERGEEKEG